MITVDELWNSSDSWVWRKALERYWEFVKPANIALEHDMEALDLDTLRQLDSQGWYEFLRDRYFRWKYTAPNRYATATRYLYRYVENQMLVELHNIKFTLLSLKPSDIEYGLRTAQTIFGLGTAGASGLLALMYPSVFGTVDQFVVKALRTISNLPESEDLMRMKEDSLTISNGMILIRIMQRKAIEINRLFQTDEWTPRKIDKILWTYGREEGLSSAFEKQSVNYNEYIKSQNMTSSHKQERRLGMTNHEMIAAAVKNHRGKILSTKEIEKIVLEAFSDFSKGSLLPNDHAEGNKSPCNCAGTENRIFDKIARNMYRVR